MFLILEADTPEAGEQAWFKLWLAVSSTLSAKPFVESPMAPSTWWSQQTLWEVQRAWGGLGMVPHSPDPVWAHAVSRLTSLRAHLPSIPPPAQTCSLHGAASAGGSACMWGGDTWLSMLYLIAPHMLATGPTAFRSPGSPGVCPACLQGVAGRSVARQNTELHEDRADRGAQRAQLCLHHRPVCWGPFPAKPSVGLPLPSLGPPTAPGTFPVECGHHEEVRPYGGAGAWPVELISPSLGDSKMFWSLWPCSKQPSAGYAQAYARNQITNFLCITNFYFY